MSKTDKFINNKINKNIYLWNEMIHVVMLIGIFVEILKKAFIQIWSLSGVRRPGLHVDELTEVLVIHFFSFNVSYRCKMI